MITIVIPVLNEQDNVSLLLHEIFEVSKILPISEVIYIDDGSTDKTCEVLTSLRHDILMLRIIQHQRRAGQSAAFMSGVRAAGNSLVVLMDGDGQNNPSDIQNLYEIYKAHQSGNKKIMVAGQRNRRHDNILRRLSSKYANAIRSSILGDGIRDTGCSLKLVRRQDYLRLPYFDHMHRFLPALLMRDGVKILTAEISHRPRACGTSKYGFWDRLWVGIVDLIGVRWLMCRGMPIDFDVKEIF